MAAPSLYSYFESKEAIYDAMFAQGYREFLELARQPGSDLHHELRLRTRDHLRFCMGDAVRYQLLFQRTVPGFEPPAESWELAQRACALSLGGLVEFGLSQRDLDLVTAVMTGLVDQQVSNDHGGERWVTLLDDVVDMLVWHLTRDSRRHPQAENRQQHH
jgi:AcrR family transcriptional regulator